MGNIHYRDTEPGAYQGLRVWQDDQGMFVIDCERSDGTLSTTEWEYDTIDHLLDDLPLLFAVQVRGAQVKLVPGVSSPGQAQAPGEWHVNLPIEGNGVEAQVTRSKTAAERVLRQWLQGDLR